MNATLRLYLLLCLLALSPLAGAAPNAPATAGAQPPRTLTQAELGGRVFARNCSVCHGDDGGGAVWATQSLRRPPRNFRTEQSRQELTSGRIRNAVTNGIAGTAMMSFARQLSAEEIAAVVRHIETRFLGRDAAAIAANAAAAAATGFPQGLRGDADQGREFYAGNCATCHGLRGDGRGPRAYFISPPPRNFIDPASRSFDRASLFTAVSDGRPGREMPAWRQVLTPQQVANVSEYVYREFIAAARERDVRGGNGVRGGEGRSGAADGGGSSASGGRTNGDAGGGR